MDFDATGQLMIIYAAFVKYLRKKTKTKQCISSLQTSRKLMIQLGGRSCIIFSLEFGIPMKLVSIIKVCQTEMYNRVWVGKNLSDMFPTRNGLKQGDVLSPFLFNFALEYAIRRVQVNQDGVKLNGTHQLLRYADDSMLGGSVHTIKENAEALVVASKDTGPERNVDELVHGYVSRSECRTKSQYKD